MTTTLAEPQAVLAYLNQLTAQKQTGEVLFNYNELTAKVYLNEGLIVWAFASGQKESFQTILIRDNHLGREDLLEGIKEARKNGKKSLDEILLALGVKDPATRIRIITAHTRSAIKTICHWTNCSAEFVQINRVAPATVKGLTLAALLQEGHKAVSTEHKEAAAPKVAPAPVASLPTNIDQLLQVLRNEVPEFVAAMIIEQKTAMPVTSLSDAPGFNVETVSAYYRDVTKSAVEALRITGSSGSAYPLEEVLVTTTDSHILLQPLATGSYLLYLLLDKNSNPAKARIIIRKYLPQFNLLLH